jgi:hypothetical protein
MRRKYATTVETLEGNACGVSRSGWIGMDESHSRLSLAGSRSFAIRVRCSMILPVYRNRRTELLTRLLANRCELCGAEEDIQVHHIRKLRDLTDKGGRERPPWVKRMAALQRKTLVVCHGCHRAITQDDHRDLDTRNEQLESGVPGNRHAPFGGGGWRRARSVPRQPPTRPGESPQNVVNPMERDSGQVTLSKIID